MKVHMEKKETNVPSQGSRIPQGAVGARDIVPVPAPSTSNDGQNKKQERCRGSSTGVLMRRKRRFNRLHISSSEEEDVEVVDNSGPNKPEDDVSPPTPSPERKKGKGEVERSVVRRGRGRPPTTGEYVGLAAAKEALLQKEREELELRAEREMLEEWTITRRNRQEIRISESDEERMTGATAKQLCGKVEDGVKAILQVAKTSGNLKGTYIKILKEAASSITDAVVSLKGMKISEETHRLEREVSRLSKEVKMLREEREERRYEGEERERRHPSPILRKEKHQNRAPIKGNQMEIQREEDTSITATATHIATIQPRRDDETLIRTIIEQVGTMMDARFEALEGRLLPEKTLRPPLGNKGGNETSEKKWGNKGELKSTSQRRRKAEGRKEVEVRPTGARNAEETPRTEMRESRPPREEGEWVTVAKRGRRDKTKTRARIQKGTNTTGTAGKQLPQRREGTKKGPKPRKIKPPKSAAVVLTVEQQPEREDGMDTGENPPPPPANLGEVLASVKKEVSLEALGIAALRPRRAATGGIIFEVPGQDSAAGADKLAAKLREILRNKGIRVDRPVKTEELRITGLDDSVTKEEIGKSIADRTGCQETDVKIGEIRRSPSGLGSAWIKCPSAYAKKLADEGRVTVGWVAARVEALQPRALHCFRCLEKGHTRSQCRATVDRSGRCYRCGQDGHTAGSCTNAVRCPLCADNGRPAAHRFGGQACSAAGVAGKKRKKKKGPAAEQPAGSKKTVALEGAESGGQ